MSHFLERVLVWAERQLPESRRMWISDLRMEAAHISGRIARQRFLWSGVLAALSEILRARIGVQRVGQTLLGLAVLTFCLGGLVVGPNIGNKVVEQTLYSVLPVYGLTGGLALLNLKWMRRFAALCIGAMGLFWLISGLELFTSMDAPVYFFRAFAVEVAMIMTGLFIAASYLGWVGDAEPA